MFQGVFKRVLLAGLAVLLVAVLVGPSGAAEPRAAVTRVITIPAAAFHPNTKEVDFGNNGSFLALYSGTGYFLAPVFFESRDVTVNSIILYAHDNNATDDTCAFLYRTTPWNSSEEQMGYVCSTGASPSGRNFTETSLIPRKVTGAYGPYLWLYLPTSANLSVHAVRINYTYTP
jgi:hypothetical protein